LADILAIIISPLWGFGELCLNYILAIIILPLWGLWAFD
jgi:hypothetical protein